MFSDLVISNVFQIRVSAVLTNGAYLLNVDCDHYFNNSKALKEAMCFMMDPAYGKKTCYVQFPQRFDGIDLHDRYANRNIVFFDVGSTGCLIANSFSIVFYCACACAWLSIILYSLYFADQLERAGWHPGSCLCGYWLLFQQASSIWV